MSVEDLKMGDDAIHGERAYVLEELLGEGAGEDWEAAHEAQMRRNKGDATARVEPVSEKPGHSPTGDVEPRDMETGI